MQTQYTGKLLILGGTIFIGKAFLDYGKKNGKKYEIHCLNRGSVYWNDSVRKDHPNVIHHFIDRNDPQEAAEILQAINKQLAISGHSKWKALIDFSCYEQTQQKSLNVLEGLFEKYITISTDSVYNNSCGRIKLPAQEKEFDLEAELRRIQQSNQIADQYGFKKMKCEVNLATKLNLKPYICLRLPDVLGEFDMDFGCQRFWCTLACVADSQNHPIPSSQTFKGRKLSFVDAFDVAKTLYYLIQLQQHPKNTAYNISYEQTITLYQFYQILGKILEKKVVYTQNEGQVEYFYPSVEFGTIDISSAKAEIDWKPTFIQDSIRRIAKFYIEEGDKYPAQKKLMLDELYKYYNNIKSNN